MTNAQRDELTGVYNRGTFKAKVSEKMADAEEDFFSCIVLVDIDDFTKVNELFGYSFGDKVIRDIARTMRLIIGEEDIVGRISGTRFILYLHNNLDLETAEKRLEIISMAVSRATNDSLRLSISMGVSIYGKDGIDFDVFINGQAILIPHAKAKELLALLVHRRGGFVTQHEIIAHLWEDEEANKVTMARARKVFMLLRDTLKEYGVEDILDSNKGARRIIPEKVNCDLYNYLSGQVQYSNLFSGYYMLNYSWGEFAMAELEQQAERYSDLREENNS